MKVSAIVIFCFWIMFFISGVFAQKKNIRNPRDILSKIDQMLAENISVWLKDKKTTYPPTCTVLRVFKKEGQCEIWAKDENMKIMELITTLPVCAMDFNPGPKLYEGDGKTPEGFFTCEFHFTSNVWWMWMVLDDKEVDSAGIPGRGSCFKIFIRYPNVIDRNNTVIAGFRNPGGAIFLHGNCVTAGCISLKNRNFLPVFAFSRHHNYRKYGPVQIHIFPFRFDNFSQKQQLEFVRESISIEQLGEKILLQFWKNLKQGYDYFKNNRNPLPIKYMTRRIFRRGISSPVMKDIKLKLQAEGLFKGEIDNYFSTDLEEVVKGFQRQNKLQADGIIGPVTLRKLEILFCRYFF